MSQELVKITINEKEIEVPSGSNLIQAAASAGIEIPHYCYHPRLSAPAVCRMCLVDVEGARKLQPACNMPVQDGLVVRTDSPKVRDAVREVLEFTLVNHPLDCPVCDQAGECGLQDYYQDYGLYNSKMSLPKLHKPKVVPIGPTLMLDSERCILCSRCVRFGEEITETNEMAILQRGDHAQIAAVKEVDNPYSTNLADICPVGALTQIDFRFKCRVWYLKETNSVCSGCSRGCNVVIDHHRGEIQRIRPRENDDVNASWMCDHGRLLYKTVHTSERLKRPMVRKSSGLEEVSWEEALMVAARLLEDSGKNTAGQLSARASNEDAYAFGALLKLLKAPESAALPAGPAGWADVDGELLRRSDRTPNRKGASAFASEVSFEERLNGAQTAIILNEDILQNPKAHKELHGVIYLGTHINSTSHAATVILPVAMWAEQTGSFTNFEGRVQRFERAVPPPAGVVPAWKILTRLGQVFGGEVARRVEDVFAAMAESTVLFQGLTFSSLGSLGAPSGQKVGSSVESSGDEKTVTT